MEIRPLLACALLSLAIGWTVDDHGHDGETWGSNLYHFAQRIFG